LAFFCLTPLPLFAPQRKPWGSMASDVTSALEQLEDRWGRRGAGRPQGGGQRQEWCCSARALAHPPAPQPTNPTPPHDPAPGRPRLLAGVPASQAAEGEALLDDTAAKLKQLELAVRTQQPDFAGVRVADVLKAVQRLEVLEAPGL
jgi:hypothetical protein